MTLDELANDPGILIGTIIIAFALLCAIDFASRRFWRWWRR
jgi:hypothetical protein